MPYFHIPVEPHYPFYCFSRIVFFYAVCLRLFSGWLYSSILQKLLAEKDDGLHTLQLTLDSLQLVLPQTSVIGRDVLRRETQALQQDYDDLSGRLLDARTTHEALLSRWSEFEESVSQVMRWLLDLDAHLMAESTLQNTMQEKKLQLDRVKVSVFCSLLTLQVLLFLGLVHCLIQVVKYYLIVVLEVIVVIALTPPSSTPLAPYNCRQIHMWRVRGFPLGSPPEGR